jgi:hypothetical protein
LLVLDPARLPDPPVAHDRSQGADIDAIAIIARKKDGDGGTSTRIFGSAPDPALIVGMFSRGTYLCNKAVSGDD